MTNEPALHPTGNAAQDAPCLCGQLRRLTRTVTAAYDEALRPSGLRITQFAILRTLARLGPATVTRLAAETALDRSTMGRNLGPLERRGLVRMERGEDRRERRVALTDTGSAAIEASLPFWRAAQARLAARLPHGSVGALAEGLRAGLGA